jgi:threonine dehydratase
VTSPSAIPATVTARDVEEAAARLHGVVERTPCLHSVTLSEITGADIVVKFENLQFTASFKERGARNRLEQLSDEERRCGVVAMSAGNHAQGLAHHAALLGIEATVVMPRATPFTKVRRTERLGARVILAGESLAEARTTADELAATEGLTMIRPFDDAAVIAGQGTVALEMLEDHPDLDVLLVPTGGGGLLSGMAIAAKAVRPQIEVIGVQSERYAAMVAALDGGPPPPCGTTIAEGIAVVEQGEITLPLVRAYADGVTAVPERRIEEAIGLLLDIEKTVAEGAGAAPLAALLDQPGRYRGRRVGIVLSGGNIDLRLLSRVVIRALARSGELTHMTVVLDDRPGALGRMADVVGDERGNIVEVSHRRDRPGLEATSAEVGLVLETRDRAHAEAIRDALERDGHRAMIEDA